MSRYRPPAAKSSPYVTEQGFQQLRDELEQLWERRGEVVKHLTAAAAEGDRSENAEYIYRKKQLREIDRRVGYLQRRLPRLKVVPTDGRSADKIVFGAYVALEEADGTPIHIRIVGADEADPSRGWISVDAPMSKALLGKRVDEEVTVFAPEGRRSLIVIDIRFTP